MPVGICLLTNFTFWFWVTWSILLCSTLLFINFHLKLLESMGFWGKLNTDWTPGFYEILALESFSNRVLPCSFMLLIWLNWSAFLKIKFRSESSIKSWSGTEGYWFLFSVSNLIKTSSVCLASGGVWLGGFLLVEISLRSVFFKSSIVYRLRLVSFF